MTFASQQRHSTSIHSLQTQLAERHQASMLASLNHRLEVARSQNNLRLVELLEQERRELLAKAPVQRVVEQFRTWWAELKNAIASSGELQVNEIYDEAGRGWWHAYDPLSGQEVYTDSHSELLLWIEKHYQGK